MIHWLQVAFSTYVAHPLHGNGYQFHSGIGSTYTPKDIVYFGAIIALFKHWNCDAPRCPRHGKHPTSDGQHRLCRKHHPDVPSHKLSLAEIHLRHSASKDTNPE